MKLMILSLFAALIAISESASLEKRDVTTDLAALVAQAKALLGEASTAQSKLTGAGKVTEAKAVLTEMDLVQQALNALTALDPQNATTLPALKVAEEVLLTEEEKLMRQLKALAAF